MPDGVRCADVPFAEVGPTPLISARKAEREATRERAWGAQTVRVTAHDDPMPCFGDDDYALAFLAGGWKAVKALQVTRGDCSATVCTLCAHRHQNGFDGSRHPSPVAQARRTLYTARDEAVRLEARRLTEVMVRAVGGAEHEDHYASSPDDLAEGQDGSALRPWTPTYSALFKVAQRLARWLVPLVDGSYAERVCDECGSREDVEFYDKPTQYSACDGGDDPDANDGGVLCAGCRERAEEFWADMWRQARS
jgi:hypothetical protein